MARIVNSNGEEKIALSKDDLKSTRIYEYPPHLEVIKNYFLSRHGVHLTSKQCADHVMHILSTSPTSLTQKLLERKL